MHDAESVKRMIVEAFEEVKYPGDHGLVDHLGGGEEPALVVREFRGKNDWKTLPVSFLDRAPDGFGSALSFFSDHAFRFYLPAYLCADLDDQFKLVSPNIQLCSGFADASRRLEVGFGARTLFDDAQYRCSVFTVAECQAILEYLLYKRALQASHGLPVDDFDQAIHNYWRPRAAPFSPHSTMSDEPWSASDKKIARALFQRALDQERSDLIAAFKRQAAAVETADDLWTIQKYLKEALRDFEDKYDFRYSRMDLLFARLLHEGRLTKHDLSGLSPAKLERVLRIASL